MIRQGDGTVGEDDRIDADRDRVPLCRPRRRRRRCARRLRILRRARGQPFLDLGNAELALLRDDQVDSRAANVDRLDPDGRGAVSGLDAPDLHGVPLQGRRARDRLAQRHRPGLQIAGELRPEALLRVDTARDFSLRARLPGEKLEWKEAAQVGLRHGQVEAVERDVRFELNGLHADPAARFRRPALGKRQRGHDAEERARAGREARDRQLDVARVERYGRVEGAVHEAAVRIDDLEAADLDGPARGLLDLLVRLGDHLPGRRGDHPLVAHLPVGVPPDQHARPLDPQPLHDELGFRPAETPFRDRGGRDFENPIALVHDGQVFQGVLEIGDAGTAPRRPRPRPCSESGPSAHRP